jgi:hypothetical protein
MKDQGVVPGGTMSRNTIVLLVAVSAVATATPTLAQSAAPGACADCTTTAMVGPPAAPLLSRWSLGVRLSTAGIENPADSDRPVELAGAGLQLRYRVAPRWELELGLDGFRTRPQGDGDGHPLQVATGSVLFHLSPVPRWDWYFLGGVGVLHQKDQDPQARQSHGLAQAGIGLGRRLGAFTVAAEFRAMVIAKDVAAGLDQGVGTSAAVIHPGREPKPVGGGQLLLSAAYNF